jgi:cathepsin D
MPGDSSYSKRLQGFINYERNTGKPHPQSLGIKNFKRLVVNNQLQYLEPLLWMGPISVGTPPVQFNVAFDTGIGDFFLATIGCENFQGHTLYDPTGSSTAHALDRNFNIWTSDGSNVSGQLWTDTVRILDFTATQQTLGAASVWPNLRRTPEDGIMGMAFRSVSTYNADPVFQTIVRQQPTDFPIFAMKLVEDNAILTLGGLNPALYDDPITWLDVTDTGYWQIESEFLSVGGEIIIQELSCIIDTARSNCFLLTLFN